MRHVDRCLSCLSCMTTCPSGVNYMHLVDHARTLYRAHLSPAVARPRCCAPCWPFVLPRPAVLRLALCGARLARPFARPAAAAGALSRQRLRAMLALAPRRVPAGACSVRTGHAALGERRARVALLAGCAQQVLAPRINEATIRLLTRLGVEVVVAAGRRLLRRADPPHGQARPGDGQRTRQHRGVEARDRGRGPGRHPGQHLGLRHHGEGLRLHVPRRAGAVARERAARISASALDISEFLTRIGYAADP